MESTGVKSGTEPQASKRVELPVQGMSCASCVATVEGGLRRTPGVREAAVNLAAERASVIFDPRSVRLEDLIKAVEGTGYAVPVERVAIPVQGLELAASGEKIERGLLAIEGGRSRAAAPRTRDPDAAKPVSRRHPTERADPLGQPASHGLDRSLGAADPHRLARAPAAGDSPAVLGRLALLPPRLGRRPPPTHPHEHPPPPGPPGR